MKKVGSFLLICALAWLTGPLSAKSDGYADIDKVYASSWHAADRDRAENWAADPQDKDSHVRTADDAQPQRSILWAANSSPSVENGRDDEWDEETEAGEDDEWDDEDWEDEEDWDDEWDEEGGASVAEEIPDPLMGLNWMFFQFNDKFYLYLWEPLAKGYGYVVPEVARKGVKNFFSNLTTPIRLVNCLLQGKWDDAGNEFARFLINTTAGVLGFGDPALKDYGPPKHEDFGQTLGYWGLNDGFFLTLPFIGPSSLRDGIGLVADGYLHPVSYIDGKPYETKWYKIAIRAYEKFNETSFQIGEYEKLKGMALDPYVAIRNIWWQNRQKKIAE